MEIDLETIPPGTDIHFRTVAFNAGGVAVGEDIELLNPGDTRKAFIKRLIKRLRKEYPDNSDADAFVRDLRKMNDDGHIDGTEYAKA